VEGEYRFWRRGAARFIEVLTPTALVHEEHETLTIAPGIYEQLVEREFDYSKVKERTEYFPAKSYERTVHD
jgi:hypothetical protein